MKKLNFLLCYDIAHPKRLQKVHRYISQHFIRVQYSVYFKQAYTAEIDKYIKYLKNIINKHDDDIRIYIVEDLAKSFIWGNHQHDILMFDHKGTRLDSILNY